MGGAPATVPARGTRSLCVKGCASGCGDTQLVRVCTQCVFTPSLSRVYKHTHTHTHARTHKHTHTHGTRYWISRGLSPKIPPRGLFRSKKAQPRVFVGRLETFRVSIAALAQHAHVSLPPPHTEGHHPSEFDKVARMQKEAMLAFLASSPEWCAKLAERYRPDICLFRFNTTPCGNMSRYQSIASNIVFI
jgi:hypothetical protein